MGPGQLQLPLLQCGQWSRVATGRNKTRPAHSSVRSPAPPAPGRAPGLEVPAPHRWHCRHNPPVEPVGRAEGDEAGHSRPATTARGCSAHRLPVPRAESPPPPLAPGRELGWTKTLCAAAQCKLRPRETLSASPCGWAPSAGLEAVISVPYYPGLGIASLDSQAIPSRGQIRWMGFYCPFLCLLSLRSHHAVTVRLGTLWVWEGLLWATLSIHF